MVDARSHIPAIMTLTVLVAVCYCYMYKGKFVALILITYLIS